MRRTRDRGSARPLIAGILLAAGRSERYGKQKLLEAWRGESLIRHPARALLESGLAPVLVVVPEDPRFAEALDGLELQLIENPQAQLGISHSIGLGVRLLPGSASAALIAVADQPLLSGELVSQLLAAFKPGSIVAPRYGGEPGNPRVYDRRFFAELLELSGDVGGQVVCSRHPHAMIEIEMEPGLGVDIDRPEDWGRLPG
jgi:molybdenum cofactor cytidylyltransferase